jgi:DNA helicase-2/ATP-dependent DNA helicase PcrA
LPLSKLNEQQFLAATCPRGHNLIIASAGTGKTSTIVGRISYLLKNGIAPSSILLLTFTNKAASEMISRIESYFDKETAKAINSGTFHSVSYKLLKQNNIDIVLKQPGELKTLFKSLYEKRVFSYSCGTNPYDGGYLYDLFSLYLNSNNLETFSEWIIEKNSSHESHALIYEDIAKEYMSTKTRFGYASFDDILVQMHAMLQNTRIEFEEILVDEYQDTNPLQGRLLDAFNSKSLFCVGDYDQSIYAFNGSDISIISTFAQRYKNANIFTLTKNYRSTKPILELANKVIANNERIYEKKLEVTRTYSEHNPMLLEFGELFDQYSYIAQKISQTQTPKENIAVIFRNNSSADGIEANLREFGISCKRKGGISFFEAKEVKFFLDFITLLTTKKDMMAFIHIIEYAKGIGKAMAGDFFEALLKLGNDNLMQGILNPNKEILNPFKKQIENASLGLFADFYELGSISKFKDLHFEDSFLQNPILKHPKLTHISAQYLYDFYKLSKELSRLKTTQSMIVHILNSKLFENVKLQLATKRATQKDGSVNETLKLESIARIERKATLLKNLAQNYSSPDKFINAMVLAGGELSEGNGVNLLSIHASKGLEFTEVYVIDLMQGRFPNTKLVSKSGSIEEERRLFYVATTRAKDILYLSYARYDKVKRIDFAPSIFLHEANLIKK